MTQQQKQKIVVLAMSPKYAGVLAHHLERYLDNEERMPEGDSDILHELLTEMESQS